MKDTALKAFLEGIIDYAGLFPPTSLPLDEAFAKFEAYLESPDRWMLARFVVPIRLLPELRQLVDRHFPPNRTLEFAVLGRSTPNWTDFFATLSDGLATVQSFRIELDGTVRVDVLETPLPAPELDFKIRADNLVSKASDMLADVSLFPYFEVPYDRDWQPRAARLLDALSGRRSLQAGFKLRTGGIEAYMVPTPEQVAWALVATRDAGVRLKATAGLHHPVRHFDQSMGTKMHGFLNVFGAGVLAHVHALDESALLDILNDEDPASFRFDEAGFSWRQLAATASEVAAFRQTSLTSFGSCSFDEPRQDLQAMGLLKPTLTL